jgi:hypothetical protein
VAARSFLSAVSAGPITPKRQEGIVEHILIFIHFASDITAMAAAIANLVDTALRHRNKRTRNE